MASPAEPQKTLQSERDESHASGADHTATEMVCFSPPKESILFADIPLLGHIQQISRALPRAACSTGLKKVSHRGTDLEGRMGSGPAEVLLCSRPSGPGHMQPSPPLQKMAVGVWFCNSPGRVKGPFVRWGFERTVSWD